MKTLFDFFVYIKTIIHKQKFNLIFIFFIYFQFISLFAQNGSVGIGTENPDNSAILHLQSDSKGLLVPVITQNQRNAIANPATGLLIYQSDNTPGFYFYNGTAWSSISAAAVYWQPGGNTLTEPSSTFIGTLNNYPFGIYTNNTERLKIAQNGSAAFASEPAGEILTVGGRMALAETSAPSATVAGFGKLYSDSDNKALYFQSSAGTEYQLSYEYAIFEDRKASGTDGGDFSSGAWRKRDLNTVAARRGNSISLNTTTSEITLKKGIYRVSGSAPAVIVYSHKARLTKTSGTATDYILGTTERNENTGTLEIQTRSLIEGIVEVDSETAVYELQHRCSQSNSGDGFGYPAGFGDDEVYSIIYIQKIE